MAQYIQTMDEPCYCLLKCPKIGNMTDVMLLQKINDLQLGTMTLHQKNTHQMYKMADR
jgi:hypothetical protein